MIKDKMIVLFTTKLNTSMLSIHRDIDEEDITWQLECFNSWYFDVWLADDYHSKYHYDYINNSMIEYIEDLLK